MQQVDNFCEIPEIAYYGVSFAKYIEGRRRCGLSRIAHKMKSSIMKRTISILLCLVTVFALLPAVGVTPVHAATTSQNNIVARADYMYNITWTPKSTVYGWNYNYTFYAGNTYRIPYGQPINSGAYIGYGVSIDNFITAANTAGSVY